MNTRALTTMMLAAGFAATGCTTANRALTALSQPPSKAEMDAAAAAGAPVAISAVMGERDSANGIDLSITFKNISADKTMKYCWFAAELLNAVGDVVAHEFSGKYGAHLQATGPLAPGKTSWGGLSTWPDAFYHVNASSVRLKSVRCEYMDGTSTQDVALASMPSAAGPVVDKVRY